MDDSTALIAVALVVGVYVVYTMNKDSVPSMSSKYLAPTTEPAYPSPTETVSYPNPPASQTQDLPNTADAVICPVTSRSEFDALSPANAALYFPSDDNFNTYLAGERARAGCFSPPNK